MRGCPHNVERTIEHRPTGSPAGDGRDYQYADLILLVCQHGCETIEIVVGDNREEDL